METSSDTSWHRRQLLVRRHQRPPAASPVPGRRAVRRARHVAALLGVDTLAVVTLLRAGQLSGLADADVDTYRRTAR